LSRATRKSKLISTSLKVLLFCTAVGVGAYAGVRVLSAAGWTPIRISKPSSGVVRRITPSQANSVRVYVVKISGGEARLTPITYQVPRSLDPKRAAIERLIAESARGGDSAGLMPRGTRVLGINTGRGLATLDLSREFTDNFHGGSIQESLTLEAIVRTLTQFRDVARVRILVQGRAVDTLGGHFELSQPLTLKSGRLAAGAAE